MPEVGQRHPPWPLLLGAAIVVVGLVGAVGVVAMSQLNRAQRAGRSLAAAAQRPTPGLSTYRDPQGRFSIGVPAGWQRLHPADPQVALLLRIKGLDSMLVRVINLGHPIDTGADVTAMKQLTDALVGAGHVHVLLSRPITVNGTRGYYYLYATPATGATPAGLHAHYFLFRGDNVHIIVFQTDPAADFQSLAPTFDEVAASYHALN